MNQLFGILNFGDWDLFEPALVRLGCCMPKAAWGLKVSSINNSGVISVWARDLVFGAWNFLEFH